MGGRSVRGIPFLAAWGGACAFAAKSGPGRKGGTSAGSPILTLLSSRLCCKPRPGSRTWIAHSTAHAMIAPALLAVLAAALLTSADPAVNVDPLKYVDPAISTGGFGFGVGGDPPGAQVRPRESGLHLHPPYPLTLTHHTQWPFGAIRASPDTITVSAWTSA